MERFEKFYKITILRNVRVILLTFLILILSLVGIVYTYTSPEVYKNIVLRVAVFYLGSIVTMNIFINSKIQSISSSSNPRKAPIIIGVICSFSILFTIPEIIYYPDPLIQNYFKLIFEIDWNKYMTLGLINVSLFIISTTVFISSLIKLVEPFNKMIHKKYNNIIKFRAIRNIMISNINEKNKENLDIKKLNVSNQNYNKLSAELYRDNFEKFEIRELTKDIEVYVECLTYLLSINHNGYLKEHISNWGQICSNIQSFIFHVEKLDDDYEELYIKTLKLTNKLISETSEKFRYKEYHDELVSIYLLGMPIYQESLLEENFVKSYVRNHRQLNPSYYRELYKIVEYLYFDKKQIDILNKLLNDEKFNTLIIEQYNFLKSRGKIEITDEEHYLEYLFLTILFKLVRENQNMDLPTILSLIFRTQEIKKNVKEDGTHSPSAIVAAKSILKVIESAKDTKNSRLDKNARKSKANNFTEQWNKKIKQQSKYNVDLSDQVVYFVILAIIKACEIENYKAAGYLVKRLCNSVKLEKIKEIKIRIQTDIEEQKTFNLRLTQVTLNGYSLDYCFNKTFFLLLLQYSYEKKDLILDFDSYISSKYKNSIIDSFLEKHKEYNLYCINKKELKRLGLVEELE